MDAEKGEKETPQQKKAGEHDSENATAQSTAENGAKVQGATGETLNDAYDKTAQVVSDTYQQAKHYSSNNPGKTILFALGIGVGLGFLLGASSRRLRTGRIVRPVVNAISDIALEYFR